MKRVTSVLLCVAALLMSSAAHAQRKNISALFIGNSYTFFHGGVNNLVSAMVNTKTGMKMNTTAAVEGGYCLDQHSNPEDPAKTINKLKSKKWTCVVLQEQSLFPFLQRDAMIEAGCKIHKTILEKSPQTQVLLYETWARKETPGFSAGYGDDEKLKDEMGRSYGVDLKNKTATAWLKNGIRGAYAELKVAIDKQADEYNGDAKHKIKAKQAVVVPVGSYWELCRKTYPEINLYYKDGSHQSLEGNYLTALIFYKTITGDTKLVGMYKKLTARRINPGIPANVAAKLETVAQMPLP